MALDVAASLFVLGVHGGERVSVFGAGSSEQVWHYHVVLDPCGHRQAFDLRQNLAFDVLEKDPDADVAVTVPCRACGGAERTSTSLQILPGRGPCALCS